jgi:hypothetical protein
VDQILLNFDPPSSGQKWTFYKLETIYPLSRDPTPSSCPRSYWMTPKAKTFGMILHFAFWQRYVCTLSSLIKTINEQVEKKFHFNKSKNEQSGLNCLLHEKLLRGSFFQKVNQHAGLLGRSEYRLFFLRSIAQFFTQIYMNCFVST